MTINSDATEATKSLGGHCHESKGAVWEFVFVVYRWRTRCGGFFGEVDLKLSVKVDDAPAKIYWSLQKYKYEEKD